MGRYRKKPVVIDAIQFDGTNASEIAEALGWEQNEAVDYSDAIIIETLEGDMTAQVGDWIIRGVNGEVYPCKPGVFELTYEVAGE